MFDLEMGLGEKKYRWNKSSSVQVVWLGPEEFCLTKIITLVCNKGSQMQNEEMLTELVSFS